MGLISQRVTVNTFQLHGGKGIQYSCIVSTGVNTGLRWYLGDQPKLPPTQAITNSSFGNRNCQTDRLQAKTHTQTSFASHSTKLSSLETWK
jgi:hypothetical protein